MKSMRLIDGGQPPRLAEAMMPRPQPKDGEVLIHVSAAGITSTEVLWYPTSHTKDGAERDGAVLSHEFSGKVAELGKGVSGLAEGDEIYGMNDWFADGALAEFCITRPEWIAPKPRRLSDAEAASVPIGALTAWQGLLIRAGLKDGERVLIHGAAGAVGIFAVQLAWLHGAYVIATASARDMEFVKDLGAQEVLDYRARPFEQQVRDIDVVFDAVGGDTLRRSWSVLKTSGRLVTIVSPDPASTDKRDQAAFFIVEPDHQQLVEVAKLLDKGQLRTVVGPPIPLALAAEAYSGSLQKKQRGKVVVSIAESNTDDPRTAQAGSQS